MSNLVFKGTLSQAKGIRDSWLKTIDDCENRIDNLYMRLPAVEKFIDDAELKTRESQETIDCVYEMQKRSNLKLGGLLLSGKTPY